MSEATTKAKAAKAAPQPSIPPFEMPKFEMPKFEVPKMEVPAALREWAEKGAAQAKDGYEKMKSAAEEATEVLEDTYATAAKGCTNYNLKVIEAARINTNAAFDYATEMLAVALVIAGVAIHRQAATASGSTAGAGSGSGSAASSSSSTACSLRNCLIASFWRPMVA